ncbi:MAG: AzlC family ABC transporter permease [Actinomycetota bacterium]|nr:AzlC family ABC transporter permease [Actinomycetota bacterium]
MAGGFAQLGERFTLAFTFFAVGVTVSVALADRGVSAWVIVLAAVAVYSATSELAFLAVDDAGGSVVAGVVSGWLVASRFGLLATSLGTRFRAGVAHRALAAVNAFDPNVGLAMQAANTANVRRVFWRMTVAMQIGWFTGTFVGVAVGDVIGDLETWGLDAVFPAALLAIVGPQLRRRDAGIAALVGFVVCTALIAFTPGGVPILASLSGVVVALVVTRDAAPAPGAADAEQGAVGDDGDDDR